ncbi:MAG TPA: FtsW/RodA/SpoVE family cell cycle protein, partial [Accumulibacter sp.]|nr:FtsW/RodA/SpoVE family cell cycle protein [Accumulibacter sp.]
MLRALELPRRLPAEIDLSLLWSGLMLLFFGMVMVYSASMATAEAGKMSGYQPAYFLIRHAVFVTIGLVAAAAAFQVPLTTWQRWSPWLFVIGFLLLALVLVPGVGRDVNGARRWLPLLVVNLQPSELMKLFAVLYAADYTTRKMPYMHNLKRAFLPLASAMFAVGVLLLKEPDFGAFVVIISVAMGILFLGGMRARLFVFLILVLAVAFAALII